MMTLEEKLYNSCVVSKKRYKAKKYGIQSSKKRRFGILVFILMSIFTIFSKIINKGDKGNLSDTFLNYSIYCIIAKMVISFILKFMNKSVFSLNHNYIYRFFKFLGNVANILVFFFTMVAYINKSIGYWNLFAEQYAVNNNTIYGIKEFNVDWIYEVKTLTLKEDKPIVFIWKTFIPNEPIKHLITYALCVVSIITFIPTFIYFLIVGFKFMFILFAFNYIIPIFIIIFIIPILHIFLWLKLLFRPLPTFRYVYFDESDKSYVFVEKRKITGKYNRVAWFSKNFIKTLPITVIVLISATFYSLIIYTSYKYNYGTDFSLIITQMKNDYPIVSNIISVFS